MRLRSLLAAASVTAAVAVLAVAAPALGATDGTVTAPTDGSAVRASSQPGEPLKVEFEAAEGNHLTVGCQTDDRGVKTKLLGPAGQSLPVNTFDFCRADSADIRFLPWSGKYTFVLTPPSGTAVNAQVWVSVFPNIFDRAATDGTPVSVVPDFNAQDALVTFTAQAGDRIFVSCRADRLDDIPGTHVPAVLLDPRGRKISSDVGREDCQRYEFDERNRVSFGWPIPFRTLFDTWTVATSGRYTVVVDNKYNAATPVSLRVYKVPADETVAAALDGTPVTARTTKPGQQARMTFHLDAGERVHVACPPNQSLDDATLLDPAGKQIAPAQNTASCQANLFPALFHAVTAPSAGTYTLVFDPSDENVRSYTALLYKIPADVTGTAAVGGDPVTVTTTTPGQGARVTFTVGANEHVSVAALLGPNPSETYSRSALVKLLDSSGKEINTGALFGLSDYADPFSGRTIDVPGDYTLTFDYNQSMTGRISVRLTGAAAPAAQNKRK